MEPSLSAQMETQDLLPANNKTKQKRPKKHFSQEEDEHLRFLVSIYGDKKWDEISKMLPNRNPRQCRERWSKYLNPSLKTDDWTKEEDDLLLAKASEIGLKWKAISAFFPGRTDINVKSRYLLLKRKAAKFTCPFSPTLQYNKHIYQNVLSKLNGAITSVYQDTNLLNFNGGFPKEFEFQTFSQRN